jgi:hypothetical protein
VVRRHDHHRFHRRHCTAPRQWVEAFAGGGLLLVLLLLLVVVVVAIPGVQSQ